MEQQTPFCLISIINIILDTGAVQGHYSDVIMSGTASQITSIAHSFVQVQINETSKLYITDLCERNPPVTGGFPSQRACDEENVSIWWRHYVRNMRFMHIVHASLCIIVVMHRLVLPTPFKVISLWQLSPITVTPPTHHQKSTHLSQPSVTIHKAIA